MKEMYVTDRRRIKECFCFCNHCLLECFRFLILLAMLAFNTITITLKDTNITIKDMMCRRYEVFTNLRCIKCKLGFGCPDTCAQVHGRLCVRPVGQHLELDWYSTMCVYVL